MPNKLIPIKEAADFLKVSMDTLRRWDDSGKLIAFRKKERGHRYYRLGDLEIYQKELFDIAMEWSSSTRPKKLEDEFYCDNSAVFQTKLIKMEKRLSENKTLNDNYSLIVAMAGEIGNNSFDHNLGNWPDDTGIFFGFDVMKGYVVLADRGQGILHTLKRVRPELENHKEALRVAFSEVVSGRAPEARGNGLKFVRQIITSNDFNFIFQTGNAKLGLEKGDEKLNIEIVTRKIRGCIALIKF